jgi:hypothetical protein
MLRTWTPNPRRVVGDSVAVDIRHTPERTKIGGEQSRWRLAESYPDLLIR